MLRGTVVGASCSRACIPFWALLRGRMNIIEGVGSFAVGSREPTPRPSQEGEGK
ncbi:MULTISPECIES: hypothetical protein [unclassified Okeania]|uniref:hypothetical protein n=1 Tax=unclassified Okeania TaxID=2634635 RepID=UPI0013BD0C6E|nr:MULTISPECIES: hypothetical protein [unclassified Okeania]NES79380.1 hypothetical protein [Okeania sp. SIO1H4]NET15530.1 hypothetical protein [Okeania sp. SIO1H6]NET23036.1 hypothetical protein [Okeania sp. SIO1H5]NET96549.1 hypothetical protein [Okeania sp. SIO1H2]